MYCVYCFLKNTNVTHLLLWLCFSNNNDSWRFLKESACKVGDTRDIGSIPGLGRSPGEGNGNQLSYSCLENSTDRGARQATVQRDTKSGTWWSACACARTHTHTLTHTQWWVEMGIGWENFNAKICSVLLHILMTFSIFGRPWRWIDFKTHPEVVGDLEPK